jgi:ADP-ribosylglycohydrolase
MTDSAEQLLELIKKELAELAEQGCDTWEAERRADLLEREGGADQVKDLEALYSSLDRIQPPDDFPFIEPSTLDEIRAVRPQGPRRVAVHLADEVLDNKTLGGWLGRTAGCMLGKPVEGWSRDKIADLMKLCGMAELDDYLPVPPDGDVEKHFRWNLTNLLRGHIHGAARDDDTDYTIIGLCILENHGRDFTPRQVADFWLNHLPYLQTYTAERAAYRNFINGIWPPDSASFRNPYREWIGAQIRADAFGYACPGRPEEAAELAFKDASISHTKNGIYGEMWAAAMISAAFVTDQVEKALQIGLSEIPSACRLSEAIERVLTWHGEGCSAEQAIDRIMEHYGHYHGVHTINNAAIVAMALLWGESDFSRTVSLAVRPGLDTDCNGATAGSVLGVVLGADAIPAHWTDPLEDRLGTAVTGQTDLTLSGLAQRTRRLQ